jgi:hypothetical protein
MNTGLSPSPALPLTLLGAGQAVGTVLREEERRLSAPPGVEDAVLLSPEAAEALRALAALDEEGAETDFSGTGSDGEELPTYEGDVVNSLAEAVSGTVEDQQEERAEEELEGEDEQGGAAEAQGPGGRPLSKDEQREVEELRARDAEVRAHENAHVAAAGGLAGPISYEYETGPDGRRYAVGGEVPISIPESDSPEEQIRNAEKARAAALAPAEPSAQDMAVAARAEQMAAEARAEIASRSTTYGPGGSLQQDSARSGGLHQLA